MQGKICTTVRSAFFLRGGLVFTKKAQLQHHQKKNQNEKLSEANCLDYSFKKKKKKAQAAVSCTGGFLHRPSSSESNDVVRAGGRGSLWNLSHQCAGYRAEPSCRFLRTSKKCIMMFLFHEASVGWEQVSLRDVVSASDRLYGNAAVVPQITIRHRDRWGLFEVCYGFWRMCRIWYQIYCLCQKGKTNSP